MKDDRNNKDKPAYPFLPTQDRHHCTQGLTKREYFAGLAMQGELASQSNETGEWADHLLTQLSKRCIAIADALLAELDKPIA